MVDRLDLVVEERILHQGEAEERILHQEEAEEQILLLGLVVVVEQIRLQQVAEEHCKSRANRN